MLLCVGILSPLFVRASGASMDSRCAQTTDIGNQGLFNGGLRMAQSVDPVSTEPELEQSSGTQFMHSVLRFVQALRYRKNLAIAVFMAAVLLGGLYYATAPRRYASKAALLVTQASRDRLDTSITNDDMQRQNIMPTFENLIRSAAVVEGALKNLPPADQVDLVGVPQDRHVARLQAGLTAKTIRSTSILEVSYESKDPQVAMNVVQAVVQSYLDFMDTMHKGTAGDLSRMLTKERNEIEEKLGDKQKELLETRRRYSDMGIPTDSKTLHPTVQTAVTFNDALTAAQKQRAEYEALLATVQTAIANGQDLGQYLISVGDVAGRELLLSSLGLNGRDTNTNGNLEQELVNTRAQLQNLQQNLGPNHPEVIALSQKTQVIEQFLSTANERMRQRIVGLGKSELGPWLVQMVRQKLDEAKKKEEVLKNCFETARSEAVNLSGQLAAIELLEREVKRLKDMSNVLFNQIGSLDLRQNGQDVRVAVIEAPKLKAAPVSPRRSLVALAAILGGFFAASGLVMLLDALDDRFRSVEEMQGRLGLPLLTMIQPLEPPESTGLQALVTHAIPMSAASESFRTLRTALTLTHPDARQIVVTSSEPGDGKTTTLANLAVCYAQAGKRTLLIDADLRRPGLTTLMAMRGPRGLSEVLRSDVDPSQMAPLQIQPSGLEGLDILPSGARPSDPAELLGGPRLSQLLAWAETVYDMILIDSPPTLVTTDTAVIGRLVDGIVLVVQPTKNRRRLVTRVVERLELMKLPILGLIVNRANAAGDQGYYGDHQYGYGYGYGNEEYGQDEPSSDAGQGKVEEECVPFSDRNRQSFDDEESRDLLVPRRVA
jgi:polysaccharide biosynthesis transport protein